MKIAFLGPSYPFRGGISQFSMLLAENLEAVNYQIKLFTFVKQYPQLIFPGKEQLDKSKKYTQLATERVLTPYNPLTWFKTIHKIKSWKPDAIIINYSIPFFAPAYGFVTFFLKKLLDFKLVYIPHNLNFHERWLFGKILTKLAIKHADEIITLSESVFNTAHKMLPQFNINNIHKLYHPNYDFYKEESQPENKKLSKELSCKGSCILFFGYIKDYKGLDILLKSMPRILEKKPDLKLIIAGEVYGDDKKYKNIIDDLNIEDNVIFHNKFIKNEDVAVYFLSSDAVILPYRSATQSGITQLAFSFETPVISTDVGGLSEVVRHKKTGLLCKPEPVDMANTIINFYKNNLKNKLIKNIIKEQKSYSWTNFVEYMKNMILKK